jgi:hypothetical protein
MKSKITIIIEDISNGKKVAYSARMPELNDSIAMGNNLKELFKGVEMTIEGAKGNGIGIFKNYSKIIHSEDFVFGQIAKKRDSQKSKFVSHSEAWSE